MNEIWNNYEIEAAAALTPEKTFMAHANGERNLFLTGMALPFSRARMQSGTMRSCAQSPPPMTFPARALAMRTEG